MPDLRETDNSLYSNFDHVFDLDVVQELASHPGELCAHHAAWDFSGYVWYDGEEWCEQVWQYKVQVETRTNRVLTDLIESVNNDYGWG
jgi:hypothetical protein